MPDTGRRLIFPLGSKSGSEGSATRVADIGRAAEKLLSSGDQVEAGDAAGQKLLSSGDQVEAGDAASEERDLQPSTLILIDTRTATNRSMELSSEERDFQPSTLILIDTRTATNRSMGLSSEERDFQPSTLILIDAGIQGWAGRWGSPPQSVTCSLSYRRVQDQTDPHLNAAASPIGKPTETATKYYLSVRVQTYAAGKLRASR